MGDSVLDKRDLQHKILSEMRWCEMRYRHYMAHDMT
jgi:hypothetical protein